LAQRYSNTKYGIAFRYPANWDCYTAQNPGPFKAMWDGNQLIACVNRDDPDINFNVRLAKGPPPTQFAEEIGPVLSETSDQLGATVESFKSFSIGGNEAVEQHHTLFRHGTALHQRIVVVSRPAIGFIWTFTAPETSFDRLDRECFSAVLATTAFTRPRSLEAIWHTMPDWGKGALIGRAIAIALGFWNRMRGASE